MATAKKRKIRYAVVGQGYISQVAVLPAFKHAGKNSELGAIVSGDATKLRQLGRKYHAKALCSYEQYDDLLRSGDVDAVYIALPNHLHRDFTMRAIAAGVHVLCEKPMGVSEEQCTEMTRAADAAGVKLMVAYRLHFEEAHLRAIDLLKRRKIGEPRLFSSVFSIAVDKKNYRAGPNEQGGGPTFDLGIYCLNSARYLFRSEPIEVSAMRFGGDNDGQSEESMAVSLRFEGGQAASFVCSFGAFPTGHLHVVGTKGALTIENPYEYVGPKTIKLEAKGKARSLSFKMRDQFAAELLYFSERILENKKIEPSGEEGLADSRVIDAIFESAKSGRAVRIEPVSRPYPSLEQEIHRPPVRKPGLVKTKEPSKEEAA